MYRHPNGGAIVDGQADLSPIVFADRESLITQHVSVDSGHISRSLITGDTLIFQSRIFESEVECQRLTSAFVLNSKLKGRVVVRNSTVDRVVLTGPILVDSAELIGPWSLEIPPKDHRGGDYLRITGSWSRSPRWFAGNRYYIVEGGENTLYVGCKRRSFDWWLAHFNLGRRLGEDASRIKRFIETLVTSPCETCQSEAVRNTCMTDQIIPIADRPLVGGS